jgi:hypothetical protein
MSLGIWQIVLWVAAAYNLVIGAGGLAERQASRDARVVSLFVAAFGIVYAVTALDPERFRPILWAGVFGKVGVIALMAPSVRRGELPRAVGWVLAGDALFGLAFLIFVLGG